MAGIYIFSNAGATNPTDNVLFNINDLSYNTINIQTNGMVEKVRGISFDTNGPGSIRNVTHNLIQLDAPKSSSVIGLSFITANDFDIKNVSFNNLNLTGRDLVYGIRAENSAFRNGAVNPATYSQFNSNRISLIGAPQNTKGLYFGADTNPINKLIVTGIQGNKFSLTPTATAIYAFAGLPGNRVTLIADPNNPTMSISAANNKASYRTGGQGTVTPSA